jgi:hypothetical protein
MKRFTRVCGLAAALLAVAVPVALADDGGGGPTTKPTVTCSRTVFGGTILRVGVDGVLVRPGDSDTAKAIGVRLDDETVVKKGDAVVGRSALSAGKRARFLVRVCRSADRRVLTARVITLAADPPPAPPTTTTPPPTTTDPKPAPTPEVCGQGEMDTVLVAVSSTSITVRTTSAEGTKEWPIAVDGDTVVRKNDVNVSVTDLKPGDKVHVVLVRCPSGSVRALRIVFLHVGDAPA